MRRVILGENHVRMTKRLICPYCNRKLYEYERYCWFCERDVSKVRDTAEKPRCFIATAVFGEDSYEVSMLRNFRDNQLNNNFLGRFFIWSYYKISPFIADLADKNITLKKFLRAMIRGILKFIKS